MSRYKTSNNRICLQIAFSYLKSQKNHNKPSLSVLVSFFAVFLSVMSLIVVLSVMNGFKEEFQNTIIGIRPHIRILSQKGEVEFEKLQNQLSVQNIKSYPSISGEAMAVAQNGSSGVLISGILKNDFLSREMLKNSIKQGSFGESCLIIGSELAKSLSLKIGSDISIIIAKTRSTIFGSIPVHKTYPICGIFSVGMYHYDSSTIFLSFKEAQKLFLLEPKMSKSLDIILDKQDVESSTDIALSLYNKLNIQDDLYITDWQTENISFIRAIEVQTSVMLFILSIFFSLSCFIIFSGIMWLVSSKTRSIVILRTMGLKDSDAFKIFFILGFTISASAILLGTVSGVAIALNLQTIKNFLETISGVKIFDGAYYFLSYLPSKLNISSVIKTIFFTLTASLCAIYFPAKKASKIQLSNALKWE